MPMVSRIAAIVEMQILDADFAAGHMQFGRILGSGICRGTSIERIPSCTVPIFSKIEVTLRATQPGDIIQLPGERNGRGHGSDGDVAGRPLP